MANGERRLPPTSFKGTQRAPDRVAKAPHPRHGLMSFAASHKPQVENSLVLPWVDVRADMDAINRGEGLFDPATRQTWINGRLYGMHDTGKTFPMHGEGIIPTSRGTYRALTIIRGYNGVTADAEYRMGREKGVTAEDRIEAIRIWLIREDLRRHGDDWGN